MIIARVWLAVFIVLGLVCLESVRAEPPAAPAELLRAFSDGWREEAWQPPAGRRSAGYMRAQDDQAWKHRMRALRGFATRPEESASLLLETLSSSETPQRILAAQAIGYLGPAVPAESLAKALRSEPDPAVRLYLVDALGKLGRERLVDWDEYIKSEASGDVKRHVDYLRERAGKPLDGRVVERLRAWDSAAIDSAAIGQLAPDFELESAQGGTVRLSDFRGRKAVVLVFIYGDT